MPFEICPTFIVNPSFESTKKGDMSNQCQNSVCRQRYTYRVLQTIQMKLILLYVWAEPAVLGSAKTALNFKYEI